MSLCIKLSTAIIRPFGLSHGLLQGTHPSCIATYHCLYHQMPFSSEQLSCPRLSPVPNNHIFALSRPVSNVNSSETARHDKVDSGATLLTKETSNQTNDTSDPSKPSLEQLEAMSTRLADVLPKFFKLPHDFRLYNKNIVLEDNIRNVRAVGLNQYAWQLSLVKMGAHLKYGKVDFQILKITTHIEDGTVRARWRIVTYPGTAIVFAFWRFKLWDTKTSMEKYKEDWIDGFSIFHLGGDGLIYKHTIDKVIPDQDKVKAKKTINPLAAGASQLGIGLGLINGEAIGNLFDSLLECLNEIISNFMD